MRFNHLGKNIWLLHNMPFTKASIYSTTSDFVKNLFLQEIKSYKKKYIVAVTANKWQQEVKDILPTLGFKEIVTFKSFHNKEDENLTIWLKVNKEAEIDEGLPRNEYINFYNCSVSLTTKFGARCNLFILEDNEKEEPEFKRIGDTSLFYRIGEQYIVKTNV